MPFSDEFISDIEPEVQEVNIIDVSRRTQSFVSTMDAVRYLIKWCGFSKEQHRGRIRSASSEANGAV